MASSQNVDELKAIRALLDALIQRLEAEPSPSPPPGLVDIKHARVPYRTLLGAINQGELRAFKVGRKTFIRTEDEEDWITRPEHRVELEPEQPVDDIDELIEMNRRRRRKGKPGI